MRQAVPEYLKPICYQTPQPTSSKEFAMKPEPDKTSAVKRKPLSSGTVDPATRDAMNREAQEGQLACAVAFKLAAELQKSPAEIGAAADRLGIRLVTCQLGLFGYTPEKKIVRAASSVNPKLENAIREKLENQRLACREAWGLAEVFEIPRMAVSAACEALGIKIKPCQLGAF
jgi:hypothetical protein